MIGRKRKPGTTGLKAMVALAIMAVLPQVARAATEMPHPATELTWYGHAAFKIVTPNGRVLLIDPWITNPSNPTGKQDLASLNRVDLVLISHGHADHVGDLNDIARRTGAKLVCTADLGQALVKFGGFPSDQAGYATLGNFGGQITLLEGEVVIEFVPAVHSSAVTDDKGEVHAGGQPGGFVISIKNGPVIYHTGDTDVFADMALVGRYHKVDWMLACIGDHFTMGPERAAEAVRLVHPSVVVPMHFGTMALLSGTPAEFAGWLERGHVPGKLVVLPIHGNLSFDRTSPRRANLPE